MATPGQGRGTLLDLRADVGAGTWIRRRVVGAASRRPPGPALASPPYLSPLLVGLALICRTRTLAAPTIDEGSFSGLLSVGLLFGGCLQEVLHWLASLPRCKTAAPQSSYSPSLVPQPSEDEVEVGSLSPVCTCLLLPSPFSHVWFHAVAPWDVSRVWLTAFGWVWVAIHDCIGGSSPGGPANFALETAPPRSETEPHDNPPDNPITNNDGVGFSELQ